MVRGTLANDFEALNKHEPLPWDMTTALAAKDQSSLGDAELKQLDELATFSINPDAQFDLMRRRYAASDPITLLAAWKSGDPITQADPNKLSALQQTMERLARAAGGRVGAAVCLLERDQFVSVHGDKVFPMQSVYKLPIAMAVLHEVDEGRLRLGQEVEITPHELEPASLYSPIRDKFPTGTKLTLHELIGYAISQSDNVASDILLKLAGGPQAVTKFLRGLGLDEVTVAASEREMAADEGAQYRNWATPRGAVKMLAVLHKGAGLSPRSQAVLSAAMTATITGKNRIPGLMPPGTVVAHKTGTSATVRGRTAATNDIGIITLPDGKNLAVAVFICDSSGDLESRESTVARIARAAYDCFFLP